MKEREEQKRILKTPNYNPSYAAVWHDFVIIRSTCECETNF